LATPQDELVEVFDVPPLAFDYVPRFNVSPGQDVPVVAADRRGRRMGPLTWGLRPAWADASGKAFINARSESVGQTRSFRGAFAHRRCIVPADGFYEWRKQGPAKGPFYFRPTVGGVLALAGIWERHGFAILTVAANPDVSGVHHRMPVLLEPSAWALWLDAEASPDRLFALLKAAPGGTLACHPVSVRVNTPTEDDPGLVDPV